MNELVMIIWEFLKSDDGPEIYDDGAYQASDEQLLEIAQSIAEHIVASGWPKS